MFPSFKVKIEGLKDDVQYNVSLEIKSVDSNRYRYVYPRYLQGVFIEM